MKREMGRAEKAERKAINLGRSYDRAMSELDEARRSICELNQRLDGLNERANLTIDSLRKDVTDQAVKIANLLREKGLLENLADVSGKELAAARQELTEQAEMIATRGTELEEARANLEHARAALAYAAAALAEMTGETVRFESQTPQG